MMRENDKRFCLKGHDLLHIESGTQPRATREKILRVQSARGTVCCDHTTVAYKGIAFACSRILKKKQQQQKKKV